MRPGHVTLICDDPPLNVTVLLGEGSVSITGGVGGWEVTGRPRQVGMTIWQGVEPFQVSLPLMFDGYANGTGQERRLARLLAVARGDDDSPPGVLTVNGIPLPAEDWVIEGIEYGDTILDPASMKRLRQPLTLTLREYVPPKYLKIKRKAFQGAKAKTKVVTARAGDTPAKVARRVGCAWTDVRRLNPKLVHKANQKLHAGTKLRVPVAERAKHRAKKR